MEHNGSSVSPMSNAVRNAYVRTQITNALLELLEQKEMTEISIKELCDKAQVGRTSFYRNFASKEDVLYDYLSTVLKQWFGEMSEDDLNGMEGEQLAHLLFSNLENNRDFYGLLAKRHLTHLILDRILELYGPTEQDSVMEAYTKAALAYLTYGWIETWLKRGMKESAKQITDLIMEQAQLQQAKVSQEQENHETV